MVSVATNRSASDIASKGWQQENKYDLAGRVWATDSGDGVWKYFGYDKNGNQTVLVTSAGANMTGKTGIADALSGVSAANVNATYTVYDKRNLATSAVEEGRELSTTVTQTLTSSRTWNAFGEVASETDALGYTTSYAYNTMGRTIRKESPTVSITLEDGTSRYVKPSEDYYYDAAGRLVATRDAGGTYAAGGTSTNGTSKAANTGNLTRLTLLAGTGYEGGADGSGALVTVETHADGGTVTNKYDIFANLREIGRTTGTSAGTLTTTQTFDILGRLSAVTNAGGATWTYGYDELGHQVKNYDSIDGSGDAEITAFDIQGRVTASRTIGGDVTTTAYAWDDTATTNAIGAFGGWVKTVTGDASSYTATYETDLFGRDADASKDYDAAGRLILDKGTDSSSTLDNIIYSWYNTGQLKGKALQDTVVLYDPVYATPSEFPGKAYLFSYDAMGRLKSEHITQYFAYYEDTWVDYPYYDYMPTPASFIVDQTGSVEYDALGRMISYAQGSTTKTGPTTPPTTSARLPSPTTR